MTYDEFYAELSETGKRVVICMEKNPQTRSCDELLYREYKERYPEIGTSTATIERIRRKIQAKGFCLPDNAEQYDRRRRARENRFREEMPRIKKAKVQEMIADAHGQGHFDFDKPRNLLNN